MTLSPKTLAHPYDRIFQCCLPLPRALGSTPRGGFHLPTKGILHSLSDLGGAGLNCDFIDWLPSAPIMQVCLPAKHRESATAVQVPLLKWMLQNCRKIATVSAYICKQKRTQSLGSRTVSWLSLQVRHTRYASHCGNRKAECIWRSLVEDASQTLPKFDNSEKVSSQSPCHTPQNLRTPRRPAEELRMEMKLAIKGGVSCWQ
jgi:hypothetical protein